MLSQKTRKRLSLFFAVCLAVAIMVAVMPGIQTKAAYTMKELEAFGNGGYTDNEILNDAVSQEIAAQSIVLLSNNGVLPLKDTTQIALFGNGATATVKGGTGSGIVNQRERDWIDTAFEDAGYTITTPKEYREKVGRGIVSTSFVGSILPDDIELTDAWIEEALAADTAVYVIARNAGEGDDRKANNGDYYLSKTEQANLEKIAEHFDNVIVVLNTQIIDTGWITGIDNIDAVLHIGYGGQRPGKACVQVLTGEVTPSGKVSSTWAYDISDYASSIAGFSSLDGETATEYYSDGIYVGYRYFDTFGIDVAYPFGFGLSYTDFDITVEQVTADAENVTVTAVVTNTGKEYSGKEVVEVYFSAPDGKLEKPYQELAAYAKTGELAPGESETLTICYPTADMSSYSEELAAYVMEAGEYVIRVGNSSRNNHVAAVAVLNEDVITEQLSNQLPLEDGAVLEELSKNGAVPYTYEGETEEIAGAERIVLDSVTFLGDHTLPEDAGNVTTYLFASDAADYIPRELAIKTKPTTGVIQNNHGEAGYQTTSYLEQIQIVPDLPEGIEKETAKLTDVLAGRITLEQFVACLSADEMAALANGVATASVGYIYDGDGNCIAYSHAMPGNVGRTTTELFASRHVPVLAHCDGPAGIRCDQDGVISPEINEDNHVGGTYFKSPDGVTIANEDPDAETYYMYPTAFPAGSNLANTWDVNLAQAYGDAIGAEMMEYNVAAWLAPGMNIVRNPLGGRNFEYYSEDPVLSGTTAAYTIIGLQSHPGAGATVKHFFANSQENNRNAANNVISERTIREIYLKGFEIAIKQAQPMFLMTCYNANNGWSGGDNWHSINGIARGEWGFRGYVMTDWGGGQSSPYISMHAGNDMIMSGGKPTAITDRLYPQDPEFEEDGYVRCETVKDKKTKKTRTTEYWGSFIPDANGTETVKAPVASYDALSEQVLSAIDEGKAVFVEEEDGCYVLWNGFNDCICLGDLQQSALHILNVMLYTQDMKILCDELDEAFGPELRYADTPYAAGYSEAMEAPLSVSLSEN